MIESVIRVTVVLFGLCGIGFGSCAKLRTAQMRSTFVSMLSVCLLFLMFTSYGGILRGLLVLLVGAITFGVGAVIGIAIDAMLDVFVRGDNK